MPDLTKLSDADLEALAAGDFASMSDAGLTAIAGEGSYVPTVPRWGMEHPKLYGLASAARETLGPPLEALGLAGGAAIGAVAGGPTPAAPATAAVGAGLGYGMARGALKQADIALGNIPSPTFPETAQETIKDVSAGAMMEMGGQMIPAVFTPISRGGKWVFQKGIEPIRRAMTQRGAQAAAGNILKANTSAGTIYAKNAAEAADIEKQIPGLKFTAGQRTGDPGLVKLERAQLRRPGTAADLQAEHTISNNEALRQYYQKNFGGQENIDDLVAALRGQQTAVRSSAASAEKTLQAGAEALPMAEPAATGQQLLESLGAAKGAAKQGVKAAYEAVPDIEIPIGGLLDDFARISRPMYQFEETANVPPVLSRVQEVLGQGGKSTLKLSDLQGLRSDLLAQMRQARSTPGVNERLTSRLSQAVQAVEKVLSSAEQTETTGALRAANKLYRESYAQVFRQGTIGDILRGGVRGELSRTPLSQIPGKIWNTKNLSAADDLMRALPDDATNIMRDHAAYDLMRNATDAEGRVVGSKLSAWLAKNTPLLRRLGLEKDFAGVGQAQVAAARAMQASAEFEKSVAARILGSDPEKAVGAVLSGRNAAGEASRLLQMVKGDAAATKGLKNAFADHFLSSVRTTAQDLSGNPIVSNAAFQRMMAKQAPVMRVLYGANSPQMDALNTMRKAYAISIRNVRSPIGGGSDTAENVFTELAKRAGTPGRMANVLRGFFKVFSRHSEEEINEYVTRALFDPDYAQTLVKAAQRRISLDTLQETVNNQIVNLARSRQMRAGQVAAGVGAVIPATVGAQEGIEE